MIAEEIKDKWEEEEASEKENCNMKKKEKMGKKIVIISIMGKKDKVKSSS
jgi:hypothetical protein